MTSYFGNRNYLESEKLCFVNVLQHTITEVNFIEIGDADSERHDGLTWIYSYMNSSLCFFSPNICSEHTYPLAPLIKWVPIQLKIHNHFRTPLTGPILVLGILVPSSFSSYICSTKFFDY